MTRITSLDQIPNASEHVRKQLERALQGTQTCEQHDLGVDIDQVHRKQKRGHPEQDHGKLLIDWIDLLTLPDGIKPGLFFVHTPNGGFRNPIEAAIFYGQGVRKGWPDYTLYLPRGRFHGLVGELKAPSGDQPPAHQLDVLHRLEQQGYKACVWWGFDEARDSLLDYFKLPAWRTP